MPELPEVETVRRTLTDLVIGKTVERVEVGWPKMIKGMEAAPFCEALCGEMIQQIRRRGKFLLIDTSTYTLVSHLRMEGKYGVHRADEERLPHTHVVFHFTDGTDLRYRDVRKFGTMHLTEREQEDMLPSIQLLGPEPFSEAFTPERVYEGLQRTSRHVKTALLDQMIVTGLGNIYVDEVLFRSGVHPHRAGRSITEEEAARIYHWTVKVLTAAVERGGSTIRTYVNSQGKKGTFQELLQVYGRAGEACAVCGAEIVKTKTNGRGTHLCLTCQPAGGAS